MATELKSFPELSNGEGVSPGPQQTSSVAPLVQVGVVFALILVAIWTPQGHFNSAVSLAAAGLILWFTVRGPYSARECGLVQPARGMAVILLAGAAAVATVLLCAPLFSRFGASHPVELSRSWQYCIWAMLQEFMLQSFFYVRLEITLGRRLGLLGTAALFSLAHLPSPVLSVASFIGALLFCELFRRYRNIYPLGVIHGALGLAIAASLPDSLLHHMRVGLGYLMHH